MKKMIKFIILLLPIILITIKPQNIYANANNYYAVQFDYECYYSNIIKEKLISSGSNVEIISIPIAEDIYDYFYIDLYGNKDSGFTSLQNYSYINSTEIEIIVSDIYESYHIEVLDSFNNLIDYCDLSHIYLEDLIEETYTVNITAQNPTYSTADFIDENYTVECTFTFMIDTTPPQISGVSDTMTGKYTNTSFQVYGYDDLSGIRNMFILEPNSNEFQEIGSSIKLSSSQNGLIYFYAVDNAGNNSKYYYIYNDIEKPTGKFKTLNNLLINNNYTDKSFYFEGEDLYSKIDYLQYKPPNQTSWTVYDGRTIKTTDPQGLYQFRCVDKAGNTSDIYSISLFISQGDVKIVHLENSNKVYLTWAGDEYTVKINSVPYIKNQVIETEGNYNAEITNIVGITSSIEFTISCFYKLIKVYEPTCKDEGYSLYCCISCGKETKSDFIRQGKHNYDSYFKEPTCIYKGGMYYYCLNCEEDYIINPVAPTEHVYTTYISTSPTCTEKGIRKFICSKCLEEHTMYVNKYGHQFVYSKEVKQQNEIIKYYKCERCGIERKINVSNNETKIIAFTNSIINNYFKYIILILITTSSIWSIFMGIKIIIANKTDEREKAYLMIKNYIIGIIVIFIIIVAIPYLVKGIARII